MQQPSSTQVPPPPQQQQQQGGQSDTYSRGSTGGSNDADTTINNEAPHLGEITSSLEDL